MVSNYEQWLKDNSPWNPAAPVLSIAQTMRKHGYIVYMLGDHRHLTANPPEDHTPYSHTPWPGSQPYPYVLAEDIMPGGEWDLSKLGAKIFADKQAGNSELAGLKYMNWTDANGDCWHDSWEPNHSRRTSTDRGHIHLSWRTDYVHTPTNYDPFMEDIPMDQKTFTNLFLGALKDESVRHEVGQAMLEATGWDPAADWRSIAQHEGDTQGLRGWLVGDPNKAIVPPLDGSPIVRMVKAADAILAKE